MRNLLVTDGSVVAGTAKLDTTIDWVVRIADADAEEPVAISVSLLVPSAST
jgi:hypothetical protein